LLLNFILILNNIPKREVLFVEGNNVVALPNNPVGFGLPIFPNRLFPVGVILFPKIPFEIVVPLLFPKGDLKGDFFITSFAKDIFNFNQDLN